MAEIEPPAHPAVAAGPDPYRELFERSADAILILDDGAFVDCNQATVEMLRYREKEQLLRTHPSELSPPLQPDGRSSFEKANEMIATALERGSHRFEWDHVRADGEVFPVEVLLTAVPRGGRKILHVVWRDITARKRLEEHLRLTQKMEALGRMAGGIAHDFNNLLVAIGGNADLLAAGLKDERESLESVREIQSASKRAATLVRQLMAFSRKQDLPPQVFDLAAALLDLEKILRRLLGEGHQLVIRSCPEPVRILCGAGQVEQVVMNLVTNARDAMSSGGSVTIEIRRLEVSHAAVGLGIELKDGSYAVLSVSDTGEGMAPAVARRAFEPFFTTKGIGKGTGLGLATVYGIATQCGGGAEIASAVGHGTTVRVYLPITAEALSREPPRVEPAVEPRGTETILVAEDEPSVSALVVRLLRGRGYRVLAAADGLDAFALWNSANGVVNLVLTDVVMPRMGGVELVRKLRAAGYAGGVMLTSGYTGSALEDAADLGPDLDFLEKPYAPAELLARVRQALGRRTAKPS